DGGRGVQVPLTSRGETILRAGRPLVVEDPAGKPVGVHHDREDVRPVAIDEPAVKGEAPGQLPAAGVDGSQPRLAPARGPRVALPAPRARGEIHPGPLAPA